VSTRPWASAQHIHRQYPNFPEDKIEEFLIHWIQALYVPEGYSGSQMDKLERLTEQWAEDHSRRSKHGAGIGLSCLVIEYGALSSSST
jgi:hypothetical protein